MNVRAEIEVGRLYIKRTCTQKISTKLHDSKWVVHQKPPQKNQQQKPNGTPKASFTPLKIL